MTIAVWIIAIVLLCQGIYRANRAFLEWMVTRYPYGSAPRWAKMWAKITTGVR